MQFFLQEKFQVYIYSVEIKWPCNLTSSFFVFFLFFFVVVVVVFCFFCFLTRVLQYLPDEFFETLDFYKSLSYSWCLCISWGIERIKQSNNSNVDEWLSKWKKFLHTINGIPLISSYTSSIIFRTSQHAMESLIFCSVNMVRQKAK